MPWPARPPASRAASWRSTGTAAPRSTGWRGGVSSCMQSSPSRSAIRGAIGGARAMSGAAPRRGGGSFELHAELAGSLGNPWGYRRLETYAGYAAESGGEAGRGERPWLSDAVSLSGKLGSPQTTALVEPHAFTTGLMRAAEKHGA